MASGCINGSLEGANYASPVPVIGLYIAVGSLVCLCFMLFDIFSALRHRQNWIPCRLFSLNSFLLTLLSIASKVPVDLTTPMPGVPDQLCKLTGTTVICISIAFVSPSLVSISNSEFLPNIASLVVLVVTVVVNICIQISTGMIHLFITEHIIVMCCMLLLLVLLWYLSSFLRTYNEIQLYGNKSFLKEMDGSENVSMFQRLKLCYVYGFGSNPQLIACTHLNYSTMAGLCFICFCVLFQATVRSVVLKQLKFCEGKSDYGWSMWIIVVTQILVVIVGCCVTSFRWFALFPRVKYVMFDKEYESDTVNYSIRNHRVYGARPWHKLGIFLQKYGWYIVLLARIVIMGAPAIAFRIVRIVGRYMFGKRKNDSVSIQELEHEIGMTSGNQDRPVKWTMEIASNHIKRWTSISRNAPLTFLPLVLKRTLPSQIFHNMELKDARVHNCFSSKVSSLSIVTLVRMATCCMPQELTEPLARCLDEAYELILYIETRICWSNREDRIRSKLSKAMLIGDGFDQYVPQIIKESSSDDSHHLQTQLNHALLVFDKLYPLARGHYVGFELKAITRAIKRGKYQTIEDLYHHVEEIFVGMLHLFLAELPNAIFQDVNESPTEQLHERVKVALKYLLKIESFESEIKWSFPVGTEIVSLMTPQPQAPGISGDNTQNLPTNLREDV